MNTARNEAIDKLISTGTFDSGSIPNNLRWIEITNIPALLLRLQKIEKTILALLYYYGCSIGEISKYLKLPLQIIKSKKEQALKTLLFLLPAEAQTA